MQAASAYSVPMTQTPAPALRPLSTVAREAARLINALPDTHMAKWAGMTQIGPLTTVSDSDTHYYEDRVDHVIAYALGNLSSWRGEDARRIKAELKAHGARLKGKR